MIWIIEQDQVEKHENPNVAGSIIKPAFRWS